MTKLQERQMLSVKRKLLVIRRRARWTYEDAPTLRFRREALAVYRKACVVLRQLTWITMIDFHMVDQILKKIYAPAITQMFQQQTMLYGLLVGRKEGLND